MQPANITTVLFTLLIALIFQLYPWSGHGIILRPDFLLVVLLYWLLRAPHLCNVGVAWFLGLLIDLSTGSLLGQHALSFALTAFLALSYQRRIVLFNKWQLTAYVTAMLLVERILILILKLFSGAEAPGWSYLMPALTSLLLWQLMMMIFGSPSRPSRT